MKSFLGEHEGRRFLIHLPNRIAEKGLSPLVVALHALGGNAKLMEMMTGFSDKADEEGFIVAYPEGSDGKKGGPRSWNAEFCCRDAMISNVDDVRFIEALVEQISSNHNIDSKRIFVAGMSNGGMMAYKLATELSDTIAAMGVVSGAIGAVNQSSGFPILPQNPNSPVPAIIFHGKQDRLIPYEGGKSVSKSGLNFLPVKDAVNFWVENNECSRGPKEDLAAEGVTRTQYSGCKNDSDVVLYTLQNGGHSWPGGHVHLSGDEPIRTISATDLIWEFFKNHPKKGH